MTLRVNELASRYADRHIVVSAGACEERRCDTRHIVFGSGDLGLDWSESRLWTGEMSEIRRLSSCESDEERLRHSTGL